MGLIRDLFGQPAFIAGLVVMLGLVAQKKTFTEIVGGTIRAVLGFTILLLGTDIIVGSLVNFGILFERAFHMEGIIPSNEAALSIVVRDHGGMATFIFVFGLIVNVLLARLTRFKYIFLCSLHSFYMACALTPIFVLAKFSVVEGIVFGALLLGTLMTVMPALVQKPMEQITGRKGESFAHFGIAGYWLSAQIGKLFAANKKSIDDINFPKSVAFLQDSNVSVSLIMGILFLIVTAVSSDETIAQLTDMNRYVWCVLQALKFAGGIVVLVAGVQMLLAEITPAFKGFSEKIVPNSIPAYPFAILLSESTNALIAGFLASLAGGVLAMAIQLGAGSSIIILPGIVFHFFCGGFAALFGNATGGRKGALIGPFINGIILTFVPIAFFSVYSALGFSTTAFSDSDFLLASTAFGLIAAGVDKYVLMAVIGMVVAFPFAATLLGGKTPRETKESTI